MLSIYFYFIFIDFCCFSIFFLFLFLFLFWGEVEEFPYGLGKQDWRIDTF